MSRTLLLFNALALLSADPGPPSQETLEAQAAEKGRPLLARALEAVRLDVLESDLRFLADDELGGRDTPSPGLELAARYLESRVERLGLHPGTNPGAEGGTGWRYEYTLERRGLGLEDSYIEVVGADNASDATRRWTFGVDYFLGRSQHLFESDARAAVVFVGGGSKDEFASCDLAGKWALVLDDGLSLRRTQRYTESAGALGLVLARRSSEEKPFAEKYASVTRTLSEPRISNPGVSNRRAEPGIPIVCIDVPQLEELLGLAGSSLTALPAPGESLGIELHELRQPAIERISVPNICAFWPGSDPELGHEVIVVTAHFDHVGTRNGEIYNGADDNGSGSTGLLGVAEALAAHGPLRRSVLLIWLSGEEKGLWGSQAWTRAPWLPGGRTAVANINIDMIGRTEKDELYLTPTRDHDSFNQLSELAYELSPLEGFPELLSQDADWARSDHANFDRNLEIPVVFFSAGEHADYHKPTDTAEKIDYEKMQRITRLVVRLLVRLDEVSLGAPPPKVR